MLISGMNSNLETVKIPISPLKLKMIDQHSFADPLSVIAFLTFAR
jgi:hypothetical protein